MSAHPFPAGPRATPLVGNTLAYRKDRLGFLTRLHRDYGAAATIHLGRTPVVSFSAPRAFRQILVEQADRFGNRDVMLNLALLLGESTMRRHRFTPRALISRCCGCDQERSLLATDGELHDRQRAVMQEAFHGPALEQHAAEITARTEAALDRWEEGQEIELSREMQRLTAGLAFATLFGVEVDDRSECIVDAYRAQIRHANGLMRQLIPLPPSRDTAAAWHELTSVVDEIIESTVRRRAAGRTSTLVDRMLRAEGSDGVTQAVRGQVMLFMEAGHLNTSGALVWTLTLLAQHPDVASNLAAELDDVLHGAAPRASDLGKLPYLDCTVKEALRIYPPTWALARRALVDCEIDGWRLPAGTFVLFSQWVTQRSPEYFGDPERFIPARFAPGTKLLHTPSAYFPFGLGPRSCLGGAFATMMIKLVLATMIPRVGLQLLHPEEVEPVTYSVFVQPRADVTMRVVRAQPVPAEATA